MAKSSLARSGQESTDKRVERGRKLFEEHCVQFRHERGAWLVPPANDAVVRFYEVRLDPVEVCECTGFEHRGEPCKLHPRRRTRSEQVWHLLVLWAAGAG